ncbi:hypothetical protein PAXRUDRAFT_141501, partial [Paxillus rubicundulus Ve08.2h10]
EGLENFMGCSGVCTRGREGQEERQTVYSVDPSPLVHLYSSRAAMSYLFQGKHKVPLLVNTEVIHVMEIALLGDPGEDLLVFQKKMCGAT